MHKVLIVAAIVGRFVAQAQENEDAPTTTDSDDCAQPSICVEATNTCGIPYGSCYNGCDTITVSIPPCPGSTSVCNCSATSTTVAATAQTSAIDDNSGDDVPTVHVLRAQVLPSALIAEETGTSSDPLEATEDATTTEDTETSSDATATEDPVVTSSSIVEMAVTWSMDSSSSSLITNSITITSTVSEPSPFINASQNCALVAVEAMDKCHHRYGYMSNPCATSLTSIRKPFCSLDARSSSS